MFAETSHLVDEMTDLKLIHNLNNQLSSKIFLDPACKL